MSSVDLTSTSSSFARIKRQANLAKRIMFTTNETEGSDQGQLVRVLAMTCVLLYKMFG